jgi:exodeoxyribonuclease V alpha subunit
MTQHYPMLQRNLLYTGVTRGKKLVILVGQKKAVAIAIRNVSGRRRWSKLSEWLASRQSTACVDGAHHHRLARNQR